MRAEPTRVIANRDFDEFQKLAYLGVVYCKVKKDRKNWFGLAIFAIRLNRKKEGKKFTADATGVSANRELIIYFICRHQLTKFVS